MFKVTRKVLAFDDVLIIPDYSTIKSRTEVSVHNTAGMLPIMSAPMDTVSGPEMCKALWENGCFGILHRYCTIEQQVKWVKEIKKDGGHCAVAIGATGDFLERADRLAELGIRSFCIDIAHGDHEIMCSAIKTLRTRFGNKAYLIAGNVATADGALRLVDAGADVIRTSVGSGATCLTRINTGCGIPTLQAILDIKNAFERRRIKNSILADGGIKNSGDIAKAFAAGADLVMLGSMLAGTDEAPGDIVDENGKPPGMYAEKLFKAFRGMASREAQADWGRDPGQIRVEGASGLVPYKGPVKNVIESIVHGLQSAFSYVNARNLSEFYQMSQLVEVTNAGIRENGAHGLVR